MQDGTREPCVGSAVAAGIMQLMVCVLQLFMLNTHTSVCLDTILLALRVSAYKWSTSHRWSDTNYTTHTKIPLLVDRNEINCVINGITNTCAPHNSVGASKIYWMNELNFIFVLATCPVCVCVCVALCRSHFIRWQFRWGYYSIVYGPERAWYLLCIIASTRIKPLRTMMTNIVMPVYFIGIAIIGNTNLLSIVSRRLCHPIASIIIIITINWKSISIRMNVLAIAVAVASPPSPVAWNFVIKLNWVTVHAIHCTRHNFIMTRVNYTSRIERCRRPRTGPRKREKCRRTAICVWLTANIRILDKFEYTSRNFHVIVSKYWFRFRFEFQNN